MQDEKQTPVDEGKIASKGELALRSPFIKKLENYWYHYKWYTIAGIILLVAVLLCTLQMCSKDNYDIEFIYAGPKNTKIGQTTPDICATLNGIVPDGNDDGKTAVNLVSYLVDETIGVGEDDEGYTSSDLILMKNNSYNNREAFINEIQAGNVSICLLSPYLFNEVAPQGAFLPITEVCSSVASDDARLYRNENGAVSAYGLQLSSLPIYQMAGFSALPADTILCIRTISPIQIMSQREKAEKKHEFAKQVFALIVEYGQE